VEGDGYAEPPALRGNPFYLAVLKKPLPRDHPPIRARLQISPGKNAQGQRT
jgi:hypothetical protein